MGLLTKARRAPVTSLAKIERSLTASAQPIHLNDPGELEVLRRRRAQQGTADAARAWGFYDNVSSVAYGADKLGDALGRLRLVLATRPDPSEDPVPIAEMDEVDKPKGWAIAQALLNQLAGVDGSHSEILRSQGQCFTVDGEGYLVGIGARGDEPQRWEFRSQRELIPATSGRGFALQEGPTRDDAIELVDGLDYPVRIWVPHPGQRWRATSPVLRNLEICEELLILDRMARATERSRNNAGILAFPDDMDFPIDPTSADGGPDGARQKFFADMMQALMAPISNEGAASAVAPFVVWGPKDSIKEIRHIPLSRELDAWIDQRTARMLKRFAQGANLPVSVLEGDEELNHWTAWQVSDDLVKLHVEPVAQVVVAGLTTGYLRPFLRTMEVDPSPFLIWYDKSGLVARPNRAQDAKDLYDRRAISWKALRDASDFDEEDAPDDAERQLRAELEAAMRPGQSLDITVAPNERPEPEVKGPPQGGDPELPTEDDKPEVTASAARAAADAVAEMIESAGGHLPTEPLPGDVVVAASRPVREIGIRLSEIDRDLRTRLLAMCDEAMHRALETAGSRIIQKSKRSKDTAIKTLIKDTARVDIAKTLGPNLVTQLGLSDRDLLVGAFDGLEARITKVIARAQRQALDLVPGVTTDERASLNAVMDEGRAAATNMLIKALGDAAARLVFSPTPEAPARGEFDDLSLIGPAMIREAMSLAGGSLQEQGPMVAGLKDLGRRLLGLATGWFMQRVLTEHAVVVEGFEWTYGAFPRKQPFEPHALLEGKFFAEFDAEILANGEGWPDTQFFYPGDHPNCGCDTILATRSPQSQPLPIAASTV